MSKSKVLSLLIILALLSVALASLGLPQPMMAMSEQFSAIQDTYIREDEPTTYHDEDSLSVGVIGSDGTARSVLVFPVNWGTDIPDGVTITEATLTLDPTSSSGDPMTIVVQRLRRLTMLDAQANWNDYKSGSTWGTAGAASSTTDYSTSGQTSEAYSGSGLDPIYFDVTTQVQYAQTNDLDVGFRVVADIETAYDFINFEDTEDSSTPPVLTITYAIPMETTYPPTVTTGTYSNVSNTTTKLYGDITYVDNGLAALEGFEWGIDSDPLSDDGGNIDWTVTVGGSSKAEIDTAQHYAGTRSAMFYYDGSNVPSGTFAKTALTATEAISLQVRKDSAAQPMLYHGNGAKFINVMYSTDEKLKYATDGPTWHDTGITININTWTQLELANIDWATGTYDIYQDGFLVYEGAEMRTGSSFSGQVRIQDGAVGYCWIDNIGFRPYVVERGFQYGLTETPTWSASEFGLFSTGNYDLTITGLDPDTEYYYRAYVSNEEGTAYGTWGAFNTIGPPTITTVDASNIGSTTARLNSALSDDGSDDCTIKFGWGLTSESAVEDYDSSETVAGTYNTGQYPYLDVVGLLPGYTYYFRVSATNDGGTDTGDELTFDTIAGLSAPTNFIGYPLSTSISLSWSKGSGSTNTLVRYSATAYPTLITGGTYVYSGPSTTYTLEGLSSGTTYYFSAWGESGGNYSASYATLLMTTSGSGAGTTPDVDVPTEPSRWFSAPDYTSMDGLGIAYDAFNTILDIGNIPRETGWFLTAVLLAVVFGLLAYLKLGKKLLIGMVVLTVCLALGYFMKLVPFWLPLMTLILVIAFSMTHKQVNEG